MLLVTTKKIDFEPSRGTNIGFAMRTRVPLYYEPRIDVIYTWTQIAIP